MNFFSHVSSDVPDRQVFSIRQIVMCLIVVLYLPAVASTQHVDTLYRVTFVDKGTESFTVNSPLYVQTLQTFNPAAIARRSLMGKRPLLDSVDQPIAQAYLDTLLREGITPYLTLTWSNAIIAALTQQQLELLQHMAFVQRVQPVREVGYRALGQIEDCSPQRPGASQTMHDLINTTPLHDAGIIGGGVRFGLIDCGFRWQNMSSLRHLTVLKTFDFVQGDTTVSSDSTERPDQDGHGSLVLSIAAGWLQDTLIGMAPTASYLLAKTENLAHEQRIEEEAYCAAVEWLEREGAWVISSSVGYTKFDSTDEQADWSVMTGHTTWGAQYINRAASLGVMASVAAGNSGPNPNSLIIPAEADSAIAVGAANTELGAWPPSSVGPTALGRIKPDLGCLGVHVQTQDPGGVIRFVAGTSMAAPQIGGSLALLREMYPLAPSYAIRSAVYSTCTVNDSVGTQLGRGIPDMTLAARRLGAQFGPGFGKVTVVDTGTGQQVLVAVFDSSTSYVGIDVIMGTDTMRINGSFIDSLWVGFDVPRSLLNGTTFKARIMASSAIGTRTYVPANESFMDLPTRGNSIPCAVRLPSIVVSVAQSQAIRFTSTALEIVPNPVESGSTVIVRGLYRPHTIRIVHTSTGAVLYSIRPVVSDEGWKVQLPALASGHYLLIADGDAGVQSTSIIVRQ